MKKMILCSIIAMILLVFSLSGEESIAIYSRFSPLKWGRADSRDSLTLVRPVDFRGTKSVPSPDQDGYLTAVLVDGRLVSAILAQMPSEETLSDGSSRLSLVSRGGRQAFRLTQSDWDLDMIFSLEQSPAVLLDSISEFYRLDSLNKNLVLQEYRENRVIRIIEANDVLDRNGKLSFGEALLAASLIGNTFQPLYGIHDGLGFLKNMGYLLEKKQMSSVNRELAAAGPSPSAVPVKKESPEPSGEEFMEFLHRAESMPGSFPENLHVLTKTVCSIREGEDDYASPETFLARKWGGNREFALFFFKILRDKGYDVKLLRVNAGKDLPNEYLIVYKEHESRQWGMMAANYWVAERFGNWTRVPALYLSKSVLYQELDGTGILQGARWIYPGSGKWEDSFY